MVCPYLQNREVAKIYCSMAVLRFHDKRDADCFAQKYCEAGGCTLSAFLEELDEQREIGTAEDGGR